MNKEIIRLLHWLRIRSFANYLNYTLSNRANRFLTCFLAFGWTIGTMIIITMADLPEPSEYVSPTILELYGLLIVIMLGLISLLTSIWMVDVTPSEEDMLLTIPTTNATIVRSRIVRVLYVGPLAAFFSSVLILGVESLFHKIEFLQRLPFAFVSMLLFLLIAIGSFTVLAGFCKKYQRIGTVLSVAIVIFFLTLPVWFYWMVISYGSWMIGELYSHPVVRFLLAVPISSVHIYQYGGFDGSTLFQILTLSVTAIFLLFLAFSFPYVLYERHVPLLNRTMGRGAERESPPLPKILDRIGRFFRVEYPDWGAGKKALFAYGYSRTLRSSFLICPILPCLVIIMGLFSEMKYDFEIMAWFVLVAPMVIFFSAMTGFGIGGTLAQGMSREIIHRIPLRGEEVLKALILPGVIQTGICYLILVLTLPWVMRVGLLAYTLQVVIIVPVAFLTTYVDVVSNSVLVEGLPVLKREESTGRASVIPAGITSLITLGGVIVYMVVGAFFMQHVVVSVIAIFLIISLSMPIAYLTYEMTVKSIDALKPR